MTIMNVLLSVFLVISAFLCYLFLFDYVKAILHRSKNNALFKKKMEEVEEMKKNGDHHSWITMDIYNESRHVCSKTGYCPSLNGFISDEQIKEHIVLQQFENEYELFLNEKIQELSAKHGLSSEVVDELINAGLKSSEEFSKKKLKEFVNNFSNNLKENFSKKDV